MKTYIKPGDVLSPKRHWVLVHVIFDGGEGEGSLAIGRWDNRPVLAIRWNGTKTEPLGNPQSRGLPTWFVVPENQSGSVFRSIIEDPTFREIHGDTINLVKNFLEWKSAYFLAPCHTPGCPNYERPVLHQYWSEDCPRVLQKLDRNDLKLWCFRCDVFRKPTSQERADLGTVLRQYCSECN